MSETKTPKTSKKTTPRKKKEVWQGDSFTMEGEGFGMTDSWDYTLTVTCEYDEDEGYQWSAEYVQPYLDEEETSRKRSKAAERGWPELSEELLKQGYCDLKVLDGEPEDQQPTGSFLIRAWVSSTEDDSPQLKVYLPDLHEYMNAELEKRLDDGYYGFEPEYEYYKAESFGCETFDQAMHALNYDEHCVSANHVLKFLPAPFVKRIKKERLLASLSGDTD
jgi:hypothetical protein